MRDERNSKAFINMLYYTQLTTPRRITLIISLVVLRMPPIPGKKKISKKKITATTKEKETREGDQEEKPQKEKELPWHPCGVGDCPHLTQYPNNLPRHRRSKHGVIDEECCGHTYRTQADLDAHRLNKGCQKRYGPCPNCDMYFARKDHLDVHIGLNQENIDAKNKSCKKSKQYLNTKITKSGLKESSNHQSAIAGMKETSPGLHQKIVAEDKAVESRTRDYLGDWEKNKPVEGRRRPKKAVERFQLFEAKYSSLKEERDKVGKAKEALEPQETGPISTNEERMQVTYRELEIFTPPRGRLYSRYTSSPTEEFQDLHLSDNDDHAVFNADSACYSMLYGFDLSPISRQIYNKTAPVNTTVQSTESNLDRRDQLIWDDEIFSMVGQVSEKEEELMRVKLELSKHQQQIVELEGKCRSLQQANDKLSNSLSQKERELEERNQSHHHMYVMEVIRFSQGFKTAEKLAQKIVQFFKLICDEQLPNQSHYDFGLRALISVLVSAGNVKRDRIQKIKNDMQARGETFIDESVISENLPEQDILIQSVCETMVPNLVAAHIPFLFALLNDVFPGITYTRAEMAGLRKQIRNVCREEFFVCKENDGQEGRTKDSMWMKKVLQLYQISQLNHGLMLVGPSGSGKSSAWRVLLKSLERLEGTEGVAHVIDRKATTKEALFGVLDPDTREWTDGSFTRILRNIINNVREEINKRQWIIFHGDVDPELVENLDSVLDSNKLLTLPNGERLSIPPNVRVVVEVQDRKYAPLATKSRWGTVWFSEDVLTPQMLLKHYIARLRHVPLEEVKEDTVRTPSGKPGKKKTGEIISPTIQLQREVADLLKPYFSPDGLVVRALEHAATRLEHINFTRFWALNDLFSMLDQSVRTILNYNCTHQDFPMDPDGHDPFYSKALVYAILWSFAGDGNLKARKNLSEFLQGLTPIKLPPPTMLIIDYKVKIGEERISVFKSASDGSGNS